jgi:hypothetical protein
MCKCAKEEAKGKGHGAEMSENGEGRTEKGERSTETGERRTENGKMPQQNVGAKRNPGGVDYE